MSEILYDPPARKFVPFSKMQAILERHQKRIAMNLQQELWFASKLRLKGVPDPFCGDTTKEVRRERVREAITTRNLSEVRCGRKEGKECTFAEVFVLVYGMAL